MNPPFARRPFPAGIHHSARNPYGQEKQALTKNQLIQALIDRMEDESGGAVDGFSKKNVGLFLNVLSQVMVEETRKNESFILPCVGKMQMVDTKAREGRNPKTGERIQIPAKRSVRFRVAKTFKDSIL